MTGLTKTDNFLTCDEVRNADSYHLSLNLELLRGCQFSCKGCHVDTYGAKPLTDEWMTQLETWLDSMELEGQYLPTVVFVGPTDFLVADNTIEVLTQPRMIAFLNRFKRLSLQSTLIDLKGFEDIADVLKKNYQQMELEVNILMEPEHVETEKYLQTIHKHRDQLYTYLDWPKLIKSFCIMNVYDYENVKKENIAELLVNYREMHKRVSDLFDTTIDFNFSLSRKHDKLKPGEAQEAIIRVTKMFDTSVDRTNNQFIRFSFGKLTDCLIEKHYNFLNGQWFVSPLLYDRYAAFVKPLRIPMVNYTYQETERFEEALQFNQYENAGNKTECASCRYLGSCIDRNILKVMDIYDIKDCIIARDALDDINERPT